MARGGKHMATGIPGFDSASHGGLPRGRTTSVVGSAGAGKTVFALQTIAHRMRDHDEHAIFVTFEQPVGHVLSDLEGFDWDFRSIAEEKLTILDAGIRADMVRNGQFTLDALVATLDSLVKKTDATVVVFDGIDALLSMLGTKEMERQELSRVLEWLRDKELTGIVTVKVGDTRSRSRSRAEHLEYQSDCVIELDTLPLTTQVSHTLCILKYRGSDFNGDVLPLVIGPSGIFVIGSENAMAIPTPLAVEHTRLSTGLDELDELLDGGYLKSSTTLLSGSPGTAKSTLATAFLEKSAASGLKGVYISFDETEQQVATHMASVGFLVRPLVDAGMVRILSMEGNVLPPEYHVRNILRILDDFDAQVVVIDPISAVMKSDHPFAARVTDYMLRELRRRHITTVCTSLLEGLSTGTTETTLSHVSTIADTWIHVSYLAHGGERNRALTIVKSRGTAHSNQVRELLLSDEGITLKPVYTSKGEVLLGSARLQKEATDRRAEATSAIGREWRKLAAADALDSLNVQLSRVQSEIQRKEREAALLEEEEAASQHALDEDLVDRVKARSLGLDKGHDGSDKDDGAR